MTIPDIDVFVDACRQAARLGLVRCSSGNMSLRVGRDRMLVTASRSWMERVTADDVVLCRLPGLAVESGPSPSVEARFHAGIMNARADVGCVLHFQAPFATALGACGADTCYDVIAEVPFYIRDVVEVTFLMPGSGELAEAVVSAASHANVIQLRNHGQVAVGPNLEMTLQRAVFFELACEVIARAGGRAEPIPQGEVAKLRQAGENSSGQSV